MNENSLYNRKNSERKKPTIPQSIFVCILTVAAAFLAVISMRTVSLFTLIPAFAIATAALTYVFYYVRTPIAVVLPFISVAASIDAPVSALSCAWGIFLCAGLLAIVLNKGAETFSFFILGTVAYSLVAGAAFVVSLIHFFGSFTAGIEAIVLVFKEMIKLMFAEYGEETVEILMSVSDQVVSILPSLVGAVGVVTMWLTKWILQLLASKTGLRNDLYAKVTFAPKTLAWLFIILSIFEIVFMSSDAATYYSMVNVKNVLMFIFVGEGAREFLFNRKSKMSGAKKVVITILLIVTAVTFASLFLFIVAYYGAFRTAFRRSAKDN